MYQYSDKDDLDDTYLPSDIIIWECPECDKLNRDNYKVDADALYVCSRCGYTECDISEYVNDVESYE